MLLLLPAALCVTSAMADGLALKSRIVGRHRDITLTAAQKAVLDQKRDTITLTDNQLKQFADLPLGKTVREIKVFPSNVETCTCDLANVGIRTNPSTVEVSLDLFGRDLEKEARENERMFRRK